MNFALTLAPTNPGRGREHRAPAAFGTVQLADNNGSPAVVHNAAPGIYPANIPAPDVEEHRLESILVAAA